MNTTLREKLSPWAVGIGLLIVWEVAVRASGVEVLKYDQLPGMNVTVMSHGMLMSSPLLANCPDTQ